MRELPVRLRWATIKAELYIDKTVIINELNIHTDSCKKIRFAEVIDRCSLLSGKGKAIMEN